MVPFRRTMYIRDLGVQLIKKVLPVLCPHLHYPEDAVHDGTSAMEAWIELIGTSDADRRSQLKLKLPTAISTVWAMVETCRFLRAI